MLREAPPRFRRSRCWLGLLALMLSAPLAAQSSDSLPHESPHGMAWSRETFVLFEVLELAPNASERPILFDLVGWTGGAVNRLWLKADGSAASVGRATHGEYQVLYGRLVSSFWDAQIGFRADRRSGAAGVRSRYGAVLGLQGLAPNWFELEPSLFVSSGGNVSFDLTGSYDLYLTQRLVLQPRLETTVALRDEPDFGIGRGLSSASFGLRARFEVRREFAPYLGLIVERGFGRAAELARLAGESPGEMALVAGFRLWR